jgi:hypothetical protein
MMTLTDGRGKLFEGAGCLAAVAAAGCLVTGCHESVIQNLAINEARQQLIVYH